MYFFFFFFQNKIIFFFNLLTRKKNESYFFQNKLKLKNFNFSNHLRDGIFYQNIHSKHIHFHQKNITRP